MGMLLVSPFVADALAVDLGGYYYASDGSRVDAFPDEAWNRANELGTGMGITQDWILSDRLVTTAGKSVYVELNGNVIDRNLSSGANEGEVLRVEDGSTLSIYGGTEQDPAARGDASHSVSVWEINSSSGALSKVTKDICGGVITGGYSTNGGGGVVMQTNATLNLCYVTVCGNRAKESLTNGYGGGVHMARDGGTLNMDYASIVYNYAQNEGGGIFVDGGTGRNDAGNCQIFMRHSHIDYNGAGDSGAGVAIRGSSCILVGDAEQVDAYDDYSNSDFWYGQVFSGMCAETSCGSTIACNVIQDGDSSSGGAGVCLYGMAGLESDSCMVSGVNIIGNRVLKGGSGGGTFSDKENVCISACNVAYNFADTENDFFSGTVGGYGGGIDVYNDSNTIKDCTVVGNSAGQSGGGVFVYGTVNVTLGGKTIVRDNSRTDNTQDNMYLGVVAGQKARIRVDNLSSDSYIGLTLDDSYFEFEAPDQGPQLMVKVTHKAEDGTLHTVEVPQEKFDNPICLTSTEDTITLCTDSNDEYSQVHCKYAGSNEWQLFGGPVTFADLMNKGEWQQGSPTSLRTSISFRALDSAGVSEEKSVVIAYQALAETPYVDALGVSQGPEQARCLTTADADLLQWGSTEGTEDVWYAATEDVAMSGRVTVEGKVNLILCDGATLEAPFGIQVGPSAELVIWCQDGATGALNAGSVEEIYTSTLENLAGIGVSSADGAGGVVINGGVITCHGGKDAAGIGGCASDEGSGVTINNGTVTAIGGEGGAGIGSGSSGRVGYVRITGGTVVATGGSGGAGIGGNVGTVSLSLTNSGDSITAGSYACGALELQSDLRFSDGADVATVEDVLGSEGKTLVLNPIPSVEPSFKTLSLVLSGQIGVNFFMDLPAIDGVDYTQSYMEFMVGERKAARADYDARKKSESGLYYGFTCYISSIQMAEPITATFHYGDGRTVTCTDVSVETYARSFEKDAADNPGKYGEEAVNLVHAIVDYGHYVQPFLSEENGWEIGTDYAAMDDFFSDFYYQNEISDLVDEYDSQADLRSSGISDVTVRLRLESSTTLQFLFTAPEGFDVYVDNDAYELTQVSDTRWCITVPSISAHKLGDTVTVSGGTTQDGYSLSASPLAYVRIALNSSTVSDAGKTALCAFYKYYEAAMAYRDSSVVAL